MQAFTSVTAFIRNIPPLSIGSGLDSTSQYDGNMISSRRWQILALMELASVGVGLGIWLLGKGFVGLGCLFVGVFVWRLQQFVVWVISPFKAPAEHTLPIASKWQRLLLSIVCLLGAAVCAVGVYLWRLWTEEWQADLVFVLFGLLVLAPVTITEIRSRSRAAGSNSTTTD